jgi:thymidine kinase
MAITFTTGLMGAGKSKELIEKFRKDPSKRIALAAHLTEKTGTSGIVESRNGWTAKAVYLNKDQVNETIELIKHLIYMKNIDTIYIDEVQFLPKETVEKIIEVVERCKDVDVHFFGLSTTFTAEYFESSEFLLNTLPKSNTFYLSRLCEIPVCRNIAEYNGRIVNGKVAREGETFVSEKSTYMALCGTHYFS